jgi:Phage tail fibre repeat
MVKEYSAELELYLPNAVNEANDNFNLDVILNENWQKIDTFAQGQNQLNDDTTQSINNIGAAVGNLSNLTTEEKTNLVLAMNEILLKLSGHQAEDATLTQKGHVQLSSSTTSVSEAYAATPKAVKTAMDRADAAFQQANDIKGKWAGVVGSPLLSTDTSTGLESKTQTIKNNLAANLSSKGQQSTGTETLDDLVDKVPLISTGSKKSSGTNSVAFASGSPVRGTLTVSALGFQPSQIFVFVPPISLRSDGVVGGTVSAGTIKKDCTFNDEGLAWKISVGLFTPNSSGFSVRIDLSNNYNQSLAGATVDLLWFAIE